MRSDVSLRQRLIRRYRKEGLFSLAESAVLTGLRRAGLFNHYVKYRQLINQAYGYHHLSDPFKRMYINPQKIMYYSTDFKTYSIYGQIRGGDWDLNVELFEKLAKFRAIKKRHEDGVDWEKTGLFEELLDIIEEEGVIDDCKNIDDLRKRYEEVEELYQKIKKEGYKSSAELPERELKKRGDINELCVNIGRDGRLIFQGDGFHRLSIAKVLEIDRIPVRVALRHRDWQLHRQEVAKELETTTDIDPSELHPDLRDLV